MQNTVTASFRIDDLYTWETASAAGHDAGAEAAFFRSCLLNAIYRAGLRR